MADETIQALVLDPGSKSAVDQGLKRIDVDPSKVREALVRLSKLLPQDEEVADGRLAQWRMNEVSMSLELSAEAGVTLIGSATASVAGGINITFMRVTE